MINNENIRSPSTDTLGVRGGLEGTRMCMNIYTYIGIGEDLYV